MKPLIGFIGMTHLGLNSLAAATGKGFPVIGFDPNADLVERLNQAKFPVVEPGLEDLINANTSRIVFTADPKDLEKPDILYIAADVPTDDWGRSDLSLIQSLIDLVSNNMHNDAILVVLCQVPPGFTRSLKGIPANCLFYQVETLIFGRAVERALYPERFIVGCADPLSPLPHLYKFFLDSFSCPILPMRYESAELAKISINFCLVASISVANTLAEISESIGADWGEIVPALKLDRRIGSFAYLTPGLGIAGGNLERDLRTVIDIGKNKGTDVRIVEAWIENSIHRKNWCWDILREEILPFTPKPRIAVLGLSYKENTHSTKNSPSLALLSHLEKFDVRIHDPVVSPSVVPFAKGFENSLDCIEGSDVLIIVTPWSEYRNIKIQDLLRLMRGRTIIDPFHLIDAQSAVNENFSYFALGMPYFRSENDLRIKPC